VGFSTSTPLRVSRALIAPHARERAAVVEVVEVVVVAVRVVVVVMVLAA
jgi:hypothetical protein